MKNKRLWWLLYVFVAFGLYCLGFDVDESLAGGLREAISIGLSIMVYVLCLMYVFKLERLLNFRFCLLFLFVALFDEGYEYFESFHFDISDLITAVLVLPSFVILGLLCAAIKSQKPKRLFY
ncbi:hypothetical protein SOPP22_13190 [Shewanella sp. OPT22]|nr:hypothetical protein SOPP22_13190 [Shewanella sp. OPT22]